MTAGIGVLAVFAVFAFAMYRRYMPAIVALPCMAIVMMLVAGIPFARTLDVAVGGSVALAPVIVTVILGALLARVTIDTGIARALVNLAAEYGGEQPLALALVLCAVVALLFTSLSGLGAIIMVGSIVLPVMMTTGVPRTIAATLFLMAFALGFIFNLANWKFYTLLFGVVPQQLTHYALALAVVDAAALVTYACVSFSRERGYATWAQAAEREPLSPRVPAAALVTPVLPIVLYFAFHLDPTIAFVLSAIYGTLLTRGRRIVEVMTAAAIRGVEDVAPAVLLFAGIGVLLAATKEPAFVRAIEPLLSGWAGNPIAYVVLFGLCSPLVLYRGPLNPFGVGIAVFTVLLTTHAYPPLVLVAAVMAVVQVQNVCDPTNTANVWVANFTGTPIDVITKRTLPYQTVVATLAVLGVALVRPALAQTAGLYAPAAAAQHIAVAADASTPLSRAALQQAIADLRAAGWTASETHDDPNARDCAEKSYAAYVLVTTSTFDLIEGRDLDIGVRLEDCGGWIVDEWHDHQIRPHGAGDVDAARALATQGVARLRAWASSDPRATELFARGVPLPAGAVIPPFYTIFKTVDGNMRLYVRAGGAAYDAGLRTGDVLEKIDGRFWWEYGTYQTELRAYDGKPHDLQVERGASTVNLTVGER
jgi:hypothetical protein